MIEDSPSATICSRFICERECIVPHPHLHTTRRRFAAIARLTFQWTVHTRYHAGSAEGGFALILRHLSFTTRQAGTRCAVPIPEILGIQVDLRCFHPRGVYHLSSYFEHTVPSASAFLPRLLYLPSQTPRIPLSLDLFASFRVVSSQVTDREELEAVSGKAGEVGRGEEKAGLHAAPRKDERRRAGLV